MSNTTKKTAKKCRAWQSQSRKNYIRWSKVEYSTVYSLLKKGRSINDIAIELNRTEQSLRCFIRRNNISIKTTISIEHSTRKSRPCLCCQKKFMSGSPSDRICRSCRPAYNEASKGLLALYVGVA